MNLCFLLIITFLFTFRNLSYATYIINMTQILREGETMISSDGSFELGFFSPGNSNNRYIGIWYKRVTVQTVVWVANREVPLTSTSGILKFISPGGILAIQDGAKGTTIWSTNISNSLQNPVAQLLDSGNLVVRSANDDNPNNFLWESFNHPTDTFLPGMKLGWNFVTHIEVYLSTWKSSEDPASGDFTYHCDPDGYPQNILKKNGVEQYRTGPWNGLRFSGVPNLKKNSIFRYGLVLNHNEVYFHFELLNSSVVSRVVLSPSGVAQRSTWIDRTQSWIVYLTSPADNCDTYNICGGYGSCDLANSPICGCLDRFVPRDPGGWDRADWSNGCMRRKELNCEKGDKFLKYSGIKLPDTRHSWYDKNMTLKECNILCSQNCSCMAYTNLDISTGGSGCLLWYNELTDIRQLSAEGQDIYIRMSSSEIDIQRRKKEIHIVSISLVAGLLLLGLSLMLYAWRIHRKTGAIRFGHMNNNSDKRRNKCLELPHLDLHTIAKATDNFSENNKLGEGGFGPVYKDFVGFRKSFVLKADIYQGVLEEGQEVAVKRLSKTSFQGIDEFMNEVACIAKHQHRNLVKLLGCCVQGKENILVYEYMINKSLDLILFDPVKSRLLNWPKRFHIIIGIARGLMYLHQDSRLRIIHRDLKASNILLDSDMNPKISDFGLARTFGGNEIGDNTSRVVGTYGYMSPEYAVYGLFSVKSDVFSFGVLVLEIVTGKRNKGYYQQDEHYLNLLGHAWILYESGRSMELADCNLRSSHCLSEVTRSIHVGLLCVQERPEDRPSMSSVVMMLGNEVILPQAKQPGFFTGRDTMIKAEISGSNMASSVNETSMTLPEGR